MKDVLRNLLKDPQLATASILFGDALVAEGSSLMLFNEDGEPVIWGIKGDGRIRTSSADPDASDLCVLEMRHSPSEDEFGELARYLAPDELRPSVEPGQFRATFGTPID